jgi:hypothetical protein
MTLALFLGAVFVESIYYLVMILPSTCFHFSRMGRKLKFKVVKRKNEHLLKPSIPLTSVDVTNVVGSLCNLRGSTSFSTLHNLYYSLNQLVEFPSGELGSCYIMLVSKFFCFRRMEDVFVHWQADLI